MGWHGDGDGDGNGLTEPIHLKMRKTHHHLLPNLAFSLWEVETLHHFYDWRKISIQLDVTTTTPLGHSLFFPPHCAIVSLSLSVYNLEMYHINAAYGQFLAHCCLLICISFFLPFYLYDHPLHPISMQMIDIYIISVVHHYFFYHFFCFVLLLLQVTTK